MFGPPDEPPPRNFVHVRNVRRLQRRPIAQPGLRFIGRTIGNDESEFHGRDSESGNRNEESDQNLVTARRAAVDLSESMAHASGGATSIHAAGEESLGTIRRIGYPCPASFTDAQNHNVLANGDEPMAADFLQEDAIGCPFPDNFTGRSI